MSEIVSEMEGVSDVIWLCVSRRVALYDSLVFL